MKKVYSQNLLSPKKEDKGYFTEMIIFLVLMIIAMAVIVYMGFVHFQSDMEKIPVQWPL